MPDYTLPEKQTVALLTLSAQRDFTLPGSPVRAAGLGRAIPAMKRLVDGFRHQGVPIYHSVRLYRPDGTNVDVCRRQAVEEGLRILMPGSFGSELIDEVKPTSGTRLDPELLFAGKFQSVSDQESIFYRPRWGAFHDTGLEEELKSRGVTTLVICGFSFATGTRATIYEASARDFRIVLVPDAVCNSTEDGVRELGRMGVYLLNAENCLTWLTGVERPGEAA
ncbi:cysteine hydrolase family protein [Pelagibius sp. Alg239-R121]|uniref:cysteine hydrolase family protein n=1 Tax=Pelagibius sp. Alg239-R121 TaxID=2993448 RepID=UPI0024A6D59A|nr:isochorismatase family cysteine hydrolase [Pelagibius sp. Alg239-R121]